MEATEPRPPDQGKRRAWRLRPPLSLTAVLVPALVGVGRLLAGLQRPFDNSGDAAILETAIRQVGSGAQTLGPYSRFGFHQPGPAYFFVQAPFSWLTGGSPRALFLGALAINLGAALASVMVVRRMAGESAARWAAIVVAAYNLALTPALLTDPWNPYVLGLPLLLAILLAAAATQGSPAAAAGAAVVGSYLVQTHLATAPTVLAVGLVTAAVASAARWRNGGPGRQATPEGRSGPRRWGPIALAGVLLALLWVPPLVEQVTHAPGNLTRIMRFFSHAHPELDAGVDHSLPTASTEVSGHLVTLPFGRRPAGDDPPWGLYGPARTAAAAAGLLVAGGVAVTGWRRRRPFVTALGAASVVGALTATWSATRIVGEVLPYLLVWTGVLLLPAWIGLGLLLQRRRPRRTATGCRRRPSVLALTAGAVGVALTWSMLRAPLPPVPSDPDVSALAGPTRPWLAERKARSVRVRIGQLDSWPVAAGVVNRLDQAGVHVTVDAEWTPIFGDRFRPTGRESAELWITGPAATPPVPSPERLAALGSASLWARSLAGDRP